MNTVAVSGRIISFEQKPYKDSGNTRVKILNVRKNKTNTYESLIEVELYGLHTLPIDSILVGEGFINVVQYERDGMPRSFMTIKIRDFNVYDDGQTSTAQLAQKVFDPDSQIPF